MTGPLTDGTYPLPEEDLSDDLTSRSARGLAWRTGGQLLVQPITTITTMVLARLLEPSDFGLLAMAAVFVDIASTANDFGFKHAVVQKKSLSKNEMSSVFWLNILVGVFFFAVGVAAAPLLADLYDQPALGYLFPVLSLSFLFTSLSLVQNAMLTREMRFKEIALAMMVTALVSNAVAITLALLGKGVWSLVAGNLAGLLAGAVAYQAFARLRFGLRLKWTEVKHFVWFGGASTGADIASEGLSRADSFIIGRWLGASALGAYSLARHLIVFPGRKLTRVVASVTLPAFSRVQDDLKRFRYGYGQAVEFNALLSVPLFATSMVAGREVMVGLYGAKWVAGAVPFQVMCVAGMMRSLGMLTGLVFKGTGRPQVEMWWSILNVILLVAGIAFGLPFGLVGVAVGFTVASVAGSVPMQFAASRAIEMRPGQYLLRLLPSLIVAVIAGGFALGIRAALVRVHTPDLVTAVATVGLSITAAWFVARSLPWLRRIRGLETMVLEAMPRRRRAGADAAVTESES